jgi:hypothetical protein
MNYEKVEEYNDGIVVNRTARGNTAEKKRQISDQEDRNNTKAAKRQKTTEERKKQIFRNCAKNHIRTNSQSTSEILLMCNDLSMDFMEYLTQKRAEHNPL